jgi:microcystin-dependent protein
MADCYVGEIRIFCGNFAPQDWMYCNGQLLNIQQYSTLYSIIGNQYGGNGTTTFALPNLNGNAPLHQGTGNGLTPRNIASTGGIKSVTLDQSSIPTHTHQVMGSTDKGSTAEPDQAIWSQYEIAGRTPVPVPLYNATPNVSMNPTALNPVGGSQPHNNMQPYLAVNFIIAMNGYYPSRP